jgi:hypothetical protein
MRIVLAAFTAACAAAASLVLAPPAAAERTVFNNWHVHSGQPGQAPVVFFPSIFETDYASTPSLWAYCPDGTDKALVGGSGGNMFASGICMNDLYIIHLKGVPTGSPAPDWDVATVTPSGYTVYYMLTDR